jgi:hypothetical protein
MYGAKGVILYDDPKRVAPSIAFDKIYPNGEFLPSQGTQRGSLYIKNGDIYTPSFPANGSFFNEKKKIINNFI